MHIMTKGMIFIPMLTVVCMTQASHAKKEDTAEIKKSCAKIYPLAAGDSDADLISLYSQACDKKNRKNPEQLAQLQIQIAQKYQALGQNLKALQTVNQLRNQNINTPELTDIVFLAGTAISQNALNQMRTVELRALSVETYASAKLLAETIYFAQPTVPENAAAAEYPNKKKSSKKTAEKNTAYKKTKTEATKSIAPKAVKTSKAAAKEPVLKASNSSSASPFDTFNKK